MFFRFIAGFLYGLAVFTASFFIDRRELSVYAWSMSILAYYLTVAYVILKYNPTSKFLVYLRGLGTFYATWLLTSIIFHEVVLHFGVK